MSESWVIEKAVELSEKAAGLKNLTESESIQITAIERSIERARDHKELVRLCRYYVETFQHLIEKKAA